MRRLHRWLGIGGGVFGLFLVVTGAILALEPVTEAAQTGSLGPAPAISVAELAQAVTQQIDGVESIEKSANHTVWVHFSSSDGVGKTAFDPVALAPIETSAPSGFWSTLKTLHRSMFAGDFGRAIAGITAFVLLVLTVSGLTLIVKRMGGLRALISPPKTSGAQALHLDLARIAAVGLLLASITGTVLALMSFDILPSGGDSFPLFPTIDAAQQALPIAELDALKNTPLSALRELVFPYPGDPTDAFMLTTNDGVGYINPMSGTLVEFVPFGTWDRIYEYIYLLHTGQGAWFLGVLLGIMMLAAPVVIVTGVLMAIRRSKSGKRNIKSRPVKSADTIILVGSEGASTWGFAATLSHALSAEGRTVHVADMNNVGESYAAAKHLFILTATYGQGQAPANAARFLERLPRLQSKGLHYTVLGFGDRTFPDFCQFAEDVDAACQAAGMQKFAALARIDRQSAQSFHAWGTDIGDALGLSLDLNHVAETPKTTSVKLVDRIDYGHEVQAPVSIIRLAAQKGSLPRHAPGDLLGVIPPGSDVPRYYSLASAHTDGVIEICVRKQNGGLCSGFLTTMTGTDTVEIFVKPNAQFRPAKSKKPLILIGAGAGIGPLIGFARSNPATRAAQLFWGGRHPGSDYLYRDELTDLKRTGKLNSVTAAFSRIDAGQYVQDALAASAEDLRRAVLQGAQIMVCGGGAMGAEVRSTWDKILAPIGLSVSLLKSQQRYCEDVY